MKIIGIVVGLVLLLGACVGGGAFTSDQNMAVACRGYSSTLNVLVPFKPDMTEAQVDGVKTTIDVVSPLCRAAARGELDATSLESALRTIRNELRTLLLLEQEVRS